MYVYIYVCVCVCVCVCVRMYTRIYTRIYMDIATCACMCVRARHMYTFCTSASCKQSARTHKHYSLSLSSVSKET